MYLERKTRLEQNLHVIALCHQEFFGIFHPFVFLPIYIFYWLSVDFCILSIVPLYWSDDMGFIAFGIPSIIYVSIYLSFICLFPSTKLKQELASSPWCKQIWTSQSASCSRNRRWTITSTWWIWWHVKTGVVWFLRSWYKYGYTDGTHQWFWTSLW